MRVCRDAGQVVAVGRLFQAQDGRCTAYVYGRHGMKMYEKAFKNYDAAREFADRKLMWVHKAVR